MAIGSKTTKLLADRLQDLISESGKKVAEISKASGVASGSISCYQNDKQEASAENLVKLAEYFDVSVDYLLGRSDDKKGDIEVMAIEKAYGLSPGTQKTLAEWVNRHDKGEINTINTLCDNPFGYGITVSIADFLYRNYNGKCIVDDEGNTDYTFAHCDIANLHLVDIWERLIYLRGKLIEPLPYA